MSRIQSMSCALGLFALCGGLISCSTSKEGGLITDPVALTSCPQNSCANGVADASETTITLKTQINNILPSGSSFAEIAGDCYASLYPDNFFDVTLTYNGVNQTNFFPSGFVPKCNQGKFYFPVNMQGRPSGTYTLTASFVLVDAIGTQTRPPFKTIQSMIIVP